MRKRLFEYLYEQLEQHPLDRAFGYKHQGQWRYYSTAQVVQMANEASRGLLELGLKPGDKVATVVYQTLPAWVVLEFALLQIGVLNVPMYPTISAREYEYILRESECQYCFVGDGDLYDKVRAAQERLGGSLKEIFAFADEHPTLRSWLTVLQMGRQAPHRQEEVERIKANISPDDVMTLVYTSGTTGTPKGVMLTHANVVFNIESIRRLLPFEPGDRVLSFLPVSHIFERAAIYAYTAMCGSVSFTGTDNLGGEQGDLHAIRPHFFTTVPRLLEKVYDKIIDKGRQLRGLKRLIFFWALRLTDKWHFDYRPKGCQALAWKAADALVFSKWRQALGGEIKAVITGASACPVRVMRTFNAAGIRVREGYGMTEAAPAISFSRLSPSGALLGTVGPLLDGVEVIIESSEEFGPGEGEILAKSPGVMVGYYKQPEKTAEVIRYINGERWLVTGDVGTWVDGPNGRKFLKITDRKKELFKTSQGKYVAPAPLEAALKEHFLVEQAMVVGDELRYVTALIVPSVEGLRSWCDRHGIAWTELSEMLHLPEVRRRYEMLLERINAHFARHEQIKRFTLLPQLWEPTKADGSEAELTPTLKLKRRVILEKYRREIEAMYR